MSFGRVVVSRGHVGCIGRLLCVLCVVARSRLAPDFFSRHLILGWCFFLLLPPHLQYIDIILRYDEKKLLGFVFCVCALERRLSWHSYSLENMCSGCRVCHACSEDLLDVATYIRLLYFFPVITCFLLHANVIFDHFAV